MKLKYIIATLLLGFLFMGLACKPKVEPRPIPPPPVVEKKEATPQPIPEKKDEIPPPQPLRLASIYFEFDKYDIRPDAQSILADNARLLADRKKTAISIEGNCDEKGTEEYNLALGQKRADNAKDYLVKFGVESGRISTISYGKTKPVDTGHNESSWAKNRRDDFKIISE